MASLTTRNKFAAFLDQISQGERKTQYCRQLLAQISYFDPVTVFRRLDREEKGFVVPLNLKQFLEENQVNVTNDELYILFKSLDTLRQGQITKRQLAQHLLPKQNNSLASLAQSRRGYDVASTQRLPNEVQDAVTKYFEQQLQNHKFLQKLRNDLFSTQDFSTREAFRLLDLDGNGRISIRQVDNYLKAHNKYLTSVQVAQIIRIIDFNRDQIIDLNQLAQILNPFQKGYYAKFHISAPIVKQIRNSRKLLAQEQSIKDQILLKQLEKQKALLDKKRLIDRSRQKISETNLFTLQREARKNQLDKIITKDRLETNLRRSRLENQITEDEIRRSRRLEYEIKRVNIEETFEKERYINYERQRQLNIEKQIRLEQMEQEKVRLQAVKLEQEQFQRRRLAELQRNYNEQILERSRLEGDIRRSRIEQEIRQRNQYERIALEQQSRLNQELQLNRIAELQKTAQQVQYRRAALENQLRRSRNQKVLAQERKSMERLNQQQRIQRIKILENQSAQRLRRISHQTNNIGRDTRLAASLSKVVARPRAESRNKPTNIQSEIAKSRLQSELQMTRLSKR